MSRYIYPAIFIPDGKWYLIKFPDFEGCYTQGEDLSDAMVMAQDYLEIKLGLLEEEGKQIPEPSDIRSLKLNKNEIATLVVCNTSVCDGFDYWRFHKFPTTTKKEALQDLTYREVAFICKECGITEKELFDMDENSLNEKVYKVMCEIEVAEIPQEDSVRENERCVLASDIVTVLGNAMARGEGYNEGKVNFLGAIVGDIVGSVYEFNNCRKKDFPLFSKKCFATDDSIMTLAIAKALTESRADGFISLGKNAVKYMQEIGRPYPHCGFGGKFYHWIYSDDPKPYNSFGNGAAMRVSPVAYFAKTIEQCKGLSRAVTEVSHNHPEGIKGAEATAVCVWCALNGWEKDKILEMVRENYYPLDFTIDEIRPTYRFNETCQDTVPQALEAFFESKDFEDAIRTAISVGGDSDTLAAITGAVAGAYYGVPDEIAKKAREYLDEDLEEILDEFLSVVNDDE